MYIVYGVMACGCTTLSPDMTPTCLVLPQRLGPFNASTEGGWDSRGRQHIEEIQSSHGGVEKHRKRAREASTKISKYPWGQRPSLTLESSCIRVVGAVHGSMKYRTAGLANK